MALWPPGRLTQFPGPDAPEIVILDDSDVELVGHTTVNEDSLENDPQDQDTSSANEKQGIQTRATIRLTEALGTAHAELAAAISNYFFTELGSRAPPRLRALIAALRVNEVLRNNVVQKGMQGVADLAKEDVHQWANSELKARRQEWASEMMAEVSHVAADVRVCPECGGRALYETGTSASFKMPKAYAAYKCTELNCGKEVRIQE